MLIQCLGSRIYIDAALVDAYSCRLGGRGREPEGALGLSSRRTRGGAATRCGASIAPRVCRSSHFWEVNLAGVVWNMTVLSLGAEFDAMVNCYTDSAWDEGPMPCLFMLPESLPALESRL